MALRYPEEYTQSLEMAQERREKESNRQQDNTHGNHAYEVRIRLRATNQHIAPFPSSASSSKISTSEKRENRTPYQLHTKGASDQNDRTDVTSTTAAS